MLIVHEFATRTSEKPLFSCQLRNIFATATAKYFCKLQFPAPAHCLNGYGSDVMSSTIVTNIQVLDLKYAGLGSVRKSLTITLK